MRHVCRYGHHGSIRLETTVKSPLSLLRVTCRHLSVKADLILSRFFFFFFSISHAGQRETPSDESCNEPLYCAHIQNKQSVLCFLDTHRIHPLWVMLQNPQHLGQMAWHYGKGIADWLERRGRGGSRRLTGVLLYFLPASAGVLLRRLNWRLQPCLCYSFFFFFLLACYWQRDICNTGYCWGQLNEKYNLLFYCVIYLVLSAGQCFFSVFSLFLPLAVDNKCSDGCSLLHNGYNWPFLLSPWQYEDG